MLNYAIIKDGKVVNIAVAEADFAVEQGWVEAAGADIGDLYADGVFTKYDPTTDPQAMDEKSQFIRSLRNIKLKDCDWTQVSDAPVDKAAWATYRQALRDVTEQSGFPHEIIWPQQPE